ncbi:MAG: hypothetical protein NTY77_08100 [Elusimicrobia bacterium]|nr:hypothetical protein [Elusimicrobiota bacterium]
MLRAATCALALVLFLPSLGRPAAPDWTRLEAGWGASVRKVLASGRLPMIDVLSTFNAVSLNPQELQRRMDRQGVALMALMPTLTTFPWGDAPYDDWSGSLRDLAAAGPSRLIPVPAAGLDQVVRRKEDASRFLDRLFAQVLQEGYPMLGEFRFRAYPSNSEWINPQTRSEAEADIPIDGPLGQKLFSFSQAHGLPFAIRYEIEDGLLPPLEKMLAEHPKARVLWRSVGRVRYKSKARSYGPDLVRRLLAEHPNLYFDLSWTDSDDYYLPSGELTSVLWDRRFQSLDSAWARLIVEHPGRFLTGLGLDQDQIIQFDREAQSRRKLLLELPPEARAAVAYRAAWEFMFGREFR